jgi:hypothetical protein
MSADEHFRLRSAGVVSHDFLQRLLEKEARTGREIQWVLSGLTPRTQGPVSQLNPSAVALLDFHVTIYYP